MTKEKTIVTDEITKDATKENMSVLAQLRKFNAENSDEICVSLPVTEVKVFFNENPKHGAIAALHKKNGGDRNNHKFASVAISHFCRFGDEKAQLSPTDVSELLPNRDVTFLIGQCLGIEDADDEGNE